MQTLRKLLLSKTRTTSYISGLGMRLNLKHSSLV